VHVVWSAQFHDVAGQAIGAGDTTKVPDLLIQPLAMAAMVEVLLDVASGGRNGDLVGVTGRRTQLAAISAAFARHEGADAQVITAPVGDAIRDGISPAWPRRGPRRPDLRRVACGPQPRLNAGTSNASSPAVRQPRPQQSARTSVLGRRVVGRKESRMRRRTRTGSHGANVAWATGKSGR
jgi:hypothetical protein